MSARREFTPHPGSVADRAIAYLQSQPAKGAEVSSPALAEAIGVPAAHLSASLEQARDRGAVFARRKGGHLRSPLFWSLVDHEQKTGPRGPAATQGAIDDDDEGDSGCARRLAGGGDDGGSRAGGGRGIRARHGIEGHGIAANGAGLLRAQPPRAAHQGTAEHVGRGTGGLTTPEGLASQHVLKAEAARPDATDRDVPANTSPVGGPMGAGQPAAAGPAGIRIALWSDGTLQIERPDAVGGAAALVLFSADETRALVRYLDRTLIANTEEITS